MLRTKLCAFTYLLRNNTLSINNRDSEGDSGKIADRVVDGAGLLHASDGSRVVTTRQ